MSERDQVPNVTWGTETGKIDAEVHRSLYGMDQLEHHNYGNGFQFDVHSIVDFIARTQWAYRDQYPELSTHIPRDIDVV